MDGPAEEHLRIGALEDAGDAGAPLEFWMTGHTEISRFRRKAGAGRALARHVRATRGQAGRRAVVGRPRACARREDEQSKARSGAGPKLVRCRIRNPSAKTSGGLTSTGRACGRGLRQWAHQ